MQRVYTMIDDSNKSIDWDAIKAKVDTGGDSDTSRHHGVVSSIEWKFGTNPHVEVSFQK